MYKKTVNKVQKTRPKMSKKRPKFPVTQYSKIAKYMEQITPFVPNT